MDKVLYILNYLAEKAGRLLFLVFAFASICFFWKAFGATTPVSGMVNLFTGLFLSIITGGLFVKVYLPGIAEKLTFGIFGGRSYLAQAPLLLSPLWGDLKNGNCHEVTEKAKQLLETHPFHGELLYLYCQGAFQIPEEKEDALFQLEKFFFVELPHDAWRIKLLFLYADFAHGSRPAEEILPLLEKEITKKGYPQPEKDAIKKRIIALQKEFTK